MPDTQKRIRELLLQNESLSQEEIMELLKKLEKLSEAPFQHLFENLPDAVFIYENNKITDVNKAFLNLFGYTDKTEIIESPAMETLVMEEDHAIVLQAKENLKNKGFLNQLYIRYKKKNGDIFVAEVDASIIMLDDAPHILLIVRDISEKNKIQQELLNSQQHLTSISENSPDIIVTINQQLKVTYTNRVSPGYDVNDVMGSDVLNFVPEDYQEQYKNHLDRAFNGDNVSFEMLGYGAHGNPTWYAVRMSLMQNETESKSILIISTDITQQHRTRIKNNIVNSISRQLISNVEVETFYTYIYRKIQLFKSFPDVYISKYDHFFNEVTFLLCVTNGKISKSLPPPRINGSGMTEQIIQHGKGMVFNQEELIEYQKKNNLKVYGKHANTWIGVPLYFENQIQGVLAAQSFDKETEYNQEDLELLSFIGTQLGAFIGQKKHEQEIKQFENFFLVSMDLLCIANTEGYFTKVNPKFSEILGYSEEEILNKSFLDFLHPDDLEKTQNEIQKLADGIPSIDFINRYRNKNGIYIWMTWSASIDPQSGLIYAAARDVSEKMKSREMLQALAEVQMSFITNSSSKESFEKMLSTLLAIMDSEYGFIGEVLHKGGAPYLKTHAITNISWNKETSDFYEENAPKGLEFTNMKTLFGKVITSGEPVIANSPYTDPRRGGLPPGHPRMDSFMGLPFYSGDRLIGMVGIANKPNGYDKNDINILTPFLTTCSTLILALQNQSKKEEAEKELIKLADIVSHSSDAIIRSDQEGLIESFNRGAEIMLGYSKEEVIGKHISILDPKSKEKELQDIFTEVRNGTAIDSHETLQLNKSNKALDVNISAFPLNDKEGNIVGASRVLRDISQQREVQKMKEEFTRNLEDMVKERTKDLEEAQLRLSESLQKEKKLGALKSRFVATASHQFRTPLSVIQNSVGILDMQRQGMNEQLIKSFDKAYKRINDQISKMTNLMDEVLILGKINEGSITPKLEMETLENICERIAHIYNEIQNDGREISIKVVGTPTPISIDTSLIGHAVSNLVSNAFKYSIGAPSPEILIHHYDDKVVLKITDYGMGIPQDDLPFLFDRFFRCTNVGEVAGTGLGLAIAKDYIELNNGTITVESTPNKKTVITTTFKK